MGSNACCFVDEAGGSPRMALELLGAYSLVWNHKEV